MTQTCEIKTRLTLLTKSFCSRMGIQTTPLDAALRLSDAEVVKDLYQLWIEAGNEGTLDDFLLTFKGDQGDSNYQLWLDAGNEGTLEDFFATLHGKDIELRPTETYIQWKYVQDETWNNLISVETLKGDEIQLSVTETHIIWKYDNELVWNNLISLAEITGPQGIQGYSLQFTWDGTSLGIKREDEIEYQYTDLKGEQGIQGIAGREVVFQTSETHIQWKYADEVIWNDLISLAEITGPQGIQGIAGREVQIQSDGTYIQWKYADEVEWNNIVLLETLRGPQGIQGIQGIAGSEVEIQNSGTHIQWRYVGDVEWTGLVDISTLTGADGLPGEKVELRVDSNNLEYKYESDVTWTQLFDLSQLQGADGKSAYEIWLDEGNIGDVATFLTSLVGFNYRADEWLETAEYTVGEVININGNSYACKADHIADSTNQPESGAFWDSYWFLMAKGGLSAYDIWINNGGIGTEQDFLNSLIGPEGSAGESIQLQVTETYIQYKYESDVEWTNLIALADLKGEQGIPGISIVWKGSLATAPENPELNWGYYNTTDLKSYIWDGDSWEIIAQDGTGSGSGGISFIDTNLLSGSGEIEEDPLTFAAPSDGKYYSVKDGAWTEVNGIIDWQGSLAAAPESPALNWGYFNTTDNIAYIYDGDSWEVLIDSTTPLNAILDDLTDGDGDLVGLSAYEIWLAEGNTGTEQDFLDSLKGEIGPTFNIDVNHFFADDTARDAYFVSNPDELVAAVVISNGDSTTGYEQYNGTTWIEITAAIGTDLIDDIDAIIDDILDGDISVPGIMPTGGTTGQVLVKNSNDDYDASWVTL